MNDKIEFYNAKTGGLIASVSSSMITPVDEIINIVGISYNVVSGTYALDDANDESMKRMRANIELSEI